MLHGKINDMSRTSFLFLVVIIAALTGALSAYLVGYFQNNAEKDLDQLIKDFYLTENAVHVSPHSLRGKIDKGDQSFVLVDVRSAEEYEEGHIIGAINIPAYNSKTAAKDLNNEAEKKKIVSEFSKLPTDKEVIVYCYSMPCMTGRKIGKLLAENDIYVKSLNIGWNEWRYFWDLWNHEHEWNTTDVNDYIATGKLPGVPKIKNTTALSCGISELGC